MDAFPYLNTMNSTILNSFERFTKVLEIFMEEDGEDNLVEMYVSLLGEMDPNKNTPSTTGVAAVQFATLKPIGLIENVPNKIGVLKLSDKINEFIRNPNLSIEKKRTKLIFHFLEFNWFLVSLTEITNYYSNFRRYMDQISIQDYLLNELNNTYNFRTNEVMKTTKKSNPGTISKRRINGLKHILFLLFDYDFLAAPTKRNPIEDIAKTAIDTIDKKLSKMELELKSDNTIVEMYRNFESFIEYNLIARLNSFEKKNISIDSVKNNAYSILDRISTHSFLPISELIQNLDIDLKDTENIEIIINTLRNLRDWGMVELKPTDRINNNPENIWYPIGNEKIKFVRSLA